MSFPVDETTYGFRWGPALIERGFSDPRFGVVFLLKTHKFPQGVQVRVSEAGNVWFNNERVIVEKPE
jgi:hypothetical protein